MALPGVGRLTAMTLVAEIGDIARFPTAGKLCAFTGLTPQVRNSDRTLHPRPHHQPGLTLGAGILQEAAQTAKRHPLFAGAYAQLAHRRGTTIATTAITGGCWPAASTSSSNGRQHRRRLVPDALAVPHEPAIGPLT
jgi:transposase